MSFIRIETPPYPNTINLILEDSIPETFSLFHEIIKILETFEDLENTVIVLSINLVGFDDTKYSHHFKVNYTKMFKPERFIYMMSSKMKGQISTIKCKPLSWFEGLIF